MWERETASCSNEFQCALMVCLHCPTLRPIPRQIKNGLVGLYGGVHTAQRQITTQIPIEFCVLVIGIYLGLGIGLGQCEWTISLTNQFQSFLVMNERYVEN